MKVLGILLGTNTAFITDEYFKKNKKKLEVLKDPELFDEEMLKSEDIPYDYAIFCECRHIGRRNGYDVIPLYGPTLTLEDCNECDFIFCIYEATFSFVTNGYDGYNHYMKCLKKTKAKVYPSVKMQEFILDKQTYMGYLEKKNYPIIPTEFVKVEEYMKNKSKVLNSIYRFMDDGEYSELIMKPQLAGFKSGFKHYKTVTDKSIDSYMRQMNKLTYKKILVQPFVPEFLKYWEIKTMWHNGQFCYAYGTKVGGDVDDTVPVSQGGELDDKLVNQVKKVGEKIVRDIQKTYGKQILLRIDFGCCIENDEICREYFVNEVETNPTMTDDETPKDTFRLLAGAIMKGL